MIVALAAGELFEWDGLGPREFEAACGTDGFCLAAKVVAAPGTVHVEVNQVPGRCSRITLGDVG